MTSVNSMHEGGHSKLLLWDNPEGWGGERGRRRVQNGGTHVHPWLIYVDVWQKPPQYCKVISLQLNTLINEKKTQQPSFHSAVPCGNHLAQKELGVKCGMCSKL